MTTETDTTDPQPTCDWRGNHGSPCTCDWDDFPGRVLPPLTP